MSQGSSHLRESSEVIAPTVYLPELTRRSPGHSRHEANPIQGHMATHCSQIQPAHSTVPQCSSPSGTWRGLPSGSLGGFPSQGRNGLSEPPALARPGSPCFTHAGVTSGTTFMISCACLHTYQMGIITVPSLWAAVSKINPHTKGIWHRG